MNQILWRGMTRAQLDAAYDNRAAVATAGEQVAAWAERSARLRARHPDGLDLRYGPRERNRIDLFRCGAADAPLFCFIHGGYWQRNSKEGFACMAEGPLAAGCDAALIGYTLAPEVRLSEIVAEIAAAVRWLKNEGPRHGVGRGKLIVSGWSAGGHLTATAMGVEGVDAGLAISGIYDVEPCRLNNLNDLLKLTAEEAAATSPLNHLPARAGTLAIAYGEAELPELQRQSRDYWQAWRGAGLSGRLMPLAGKDHFSILDGLAKPDGALTAALRPLLAAIPA
jgi:acetyl esterase/lipase